MHDHPPPSRRKPRLHDNTKRLMFRRSMWRRRALSAALELATWQTGAPGREDAEKALAMAINKVRQWFRSPRASTVINAVQRRAVAAYRSKESTCSAT